MNCIDSFLNFRPWAFFRILETIFTANHYDICLLSIKVNTYHNGHHGCSDRPAMTIAVDLGRKAKKKKKKKKKKKLTVLPAKSDSEVMFCIQSYKGLIIDRSLV